MKPFPLFDGFIVFYRCFVDLTGSVNAALMLSRAVYWQRCNKDSSWWYQTQEKWQRETGLTRREQETARKALRKFSFWREEFQGLPRKLYYRVDLEDLMSVLSISDKSAMQDETNPPDLGQQTSHATKEKLNKEVGITNSESSDEPAGLFASMAEDNAAAETKSQTPPVTQKRERKRDEVLDALVTLNGEDLKQVTQINFAAAATAKKQIVAVFPNVTADEIKRRKLAYIKKFPGASITAHAIAKYWATLASDVKKPAVHTGIPNIHTYKPESNG